MERVRQEKAVTQEEVDWLLAFIMEGWKTNVNSFRSENAPARPDHRLVDVYNAAITLIEFSGNLAHSIDVLKAVFSQGVREEKDLAWIAVEIWFEVRGTSSLGREALALEDLKRHGSLDDDALDTYNGRIGRLVN